MTAVDRQVIDGALAGDGVSKFRIKIWEKTSGTLIYDSEPGRSDADDPITPVGEASSVIIKKQAGTCTLLTARGHQLPYLAWESHILQTRNLRP